MVVRDHLPATKPRKSAIFLVLPEEDQTKNFMAGLMIQTLSRELFAVADENGGALKNRVVLPDGIDKTLTGVASFSHAAGVEVVMDAGRSASVILPDALERMDYSLYCQSCRDLLSAAGTRGYVLLDLHRPGTVLAYPAREGTECFINGYVATVGKEMISAAAPKGYVEVMRIRVTGIE